MPAPRPRLELRGRLIRSVGRLRGRQIFVIDAIGLAIAAYAALAMGFDAVLVPGAVREFGLLLALVVTIRLAVNIRLGLYSRDWRFASVPDLVRIVGAALIGTTVALATVIVISLLGPRILDGMPRSFWVLEVLLSGMVMGGSRFGVRAASDWKPRDSDIPRVERCPTLLYGAGRTGVMMARSALRNPDAGVVPVGFLDDDIRLKGHLVEGLKVHGDVSSLVRAAADVGARAVLITMPSAEGSAVRKVVDASIAAGLDVRTVPSMIDLLDGTIDAHQVRRVQVEDLLRRPSSESHIAGVHELIHGKTIAITGAGGSIGSELARQLHSLGPRRLVLIDRAESPLYLVQRALESKAERGRKPVDVQVHLGNVASHAAIERLIAAESPDVIFHAAAYKHVPMMEEHPSDAAQVNIGGTLALLDAAISAGVERFVLVSTDKAVHPTSIMGASKRIAEMLVADAARRVRKPYVAVRFGNVLGSTGSVVPLFQEQLENGEPLTITHPDMTRFFMTIPEATWLIMDAAALGTNGDLFVLDMGEPVRIVDLARDLVRLAGRDPDSQPMSFIGLRPGEKLHEELFYDAERVERTSVAKVLRAVSEPPPATIREDVLRMLTLADGRHDDQLRAAIMAYALGEPMPVLDDDRAVTLVGV